MSDLLSNEDALKQAKQYTDRLEEEYQRKNPCPKCGSHNVHIEIDCINGAHMSGSEWCDDCGWREETRS